MASIDKRSDGHYRARWREYPGGPQKVRHFARKRDAELFLDAIRGDLAHGIYVDPAGGRTLFVEYAERWRSVQVHRPGTTTQVETYLRLHAYPYLGTRQLGAIRRSDLQAWVKELTAVLAPRSVELVYRWVATIFKAAVGDRLLASSPCIGITLPKCNDAEVVPLSVSEVEAMVAAVPDRYRALVVFAAGMGLRQGECFGLTVDRVDFFRRQVRVDRQLVSALRGVPEFGPPKSKAGFRTVPMLEVVSSALAAHLARYRPGQYGLVFTSRTGNPLRRNTLGSMWHPGTAGGRHAQLGHLSRPAAFLCLAPDRQGVLGQGRPAPPRPPVSHGDPRHLRPPLARQRRRNAQRRRYGPCRDRQGGLTQTQHRSCGRRCGARRVPLAVTRHRRFGA
jgi:integrase